MEQPNPPPLPVPAILPSCHPHPRSHSNSNTGLLITSTSTAHSNKRRRTNTGNPTYFDPTALHEFVEPQNINTDSTAEALYRFATNIKRVISDAVALTRSSSLEIRVKKIPISTLDMSDVLHLLDVQYKAFLPISHWVVGSATYGLPGTPWLETILETITNDDY